MDMYKSPSQIHSMHEGQTDQQRKCITSLNVFLKTQENFLPLLSYSKPTSPLEPRLNLTFLWLSSYEIATFLSPLSELPIVYP